MLDWGKCPPVGCMLVMKFCTRVWLVPFVLCTMSALVLSLAGCRKEEKKPEIPASSPASYMNDPVFRRELEEKRKELQAIIAERKPLADRMQELVKSHGEDLAALQKIPEWNDLHKKVTALNRKYEEARARQLRIVKDRLTPESNAAGRRVNVDATARRVNDKDISK